MNSEDGFGVDSVMYKLGGLGRKRMVKLVGWTIVDE